MSSDKTPDIPSDRGLDVDVDEKHTDKSVVITNIPPGTKKEDLFIYFQKRSNGGGEVDDVKMLEEGKAIVIFDEEKVAKRVLSREHKFDDAFLCLAPYLNATDNTEDIPVFSLVSAKLNPSCFTENAKELNGILIEAQKETDIKFLETCEGYVVTGITLEQIDKTCLFLSRYAKPRPPRPAKHKTDDDDDDDNDEVKSDLKLVELDVLSKLMTIIRKKVEAIEIKYKMKIDWKQKDGKARLSSNGNDTELFYQGKEEFISLYQKEFQDLKEMDFKLDGVDKIADLDGMLKELMTEFSVVIDKTGEKNLHIFGKEDRVSQVMQRLKASFGNRRQRRPPKGGDNGQLPRPDIHAQAAMSPPSKTLDKGIVVSVHQGDITKVAVDVIVNAANERLAHGGGVAGAIVRQGGQQIQQESDYIIQRYGLVPVGQVVHTGPGNLPCKCIFHAVGPQWKVHGQERSRQFIFQACMNSFYMASKQGMSSIALPGISSGLYGVPKGICAEVMFTAAEFFIAEAPSDNQLKDIRFINIDSPTYEAFRREFQNRFGMKKPTDADLPNNHGNTHATFFTPVAEKVTEKPNVSFDLQGRMDKPSGGWISTGYTDQQARDRDTERRKRAEAATRREEQGKKNEKAKDGEKQTECEANVKSSPNRGFLKGFETRGGEIKGPQGMKSKDNSYTDNKHVSKGKKDKTVSRNEPEKENDKMEPMERKEGKLKEKKKEEGKGEVKAKKEKEEEKEDEEEREEEEEKKKEEEEEEKKKEEEEEEKKKEEKEKEKEEEEEEEEEEKLEDKKKKEKDTDEGEKKRKDTETVSPSKMHEKSMKDGQQNGQRSLSQKSLGSTMKNGLLNNTKSEVTDSKTKQHTSDENEENENKYDSLANMLSGLKIGDKQSEGHDDSSQPNTLATTKEEEGSSHEKNMEQNLNKESKVNPDETLNKPPKVEPLNVGNVQVPKEGCEEKSHDENSSKPKSNPTAKGTQTNQGGFPGRGVTFEKQPENKSLKTSGRGRGALKVAANLTGNKRTPGHAVRYEGTSSIDKAQASIEKVSSKRPIKKPPGLTVTKEGLALVEKSREEINEVGKGDNQDEDHKNANKNFLKSVFPITADVEVPVKKPTIDEGNIEENEEGTKQGKSTEEIKEHGDQVLAERRLNGNDEFKKEISNTSGESKKDFQNHFEDKNLHETKNVQNKEEETFEDHRKMDDIQTGLITSDAHGSFSDGKENEPDISSGEDNSKESGLSNDGSVEVREGGENKAESKDLGNGEKDNSKLVNQNSFNKTDTKLKNNSDGPPLNEKPGPIETTERAKTSLEDPVGAKTFLGQDNRDGKSIGISEQDIMDEGNHLPAEATSSKENLDAVGNKAEGQKCSNKKASVEDNVSEKGTNHDKAVGDSKERINDASDPKPFEEDNPTWDISLTETGPNSMESFEVLSMTAAEHIGSPVPSRASGSSDESSESIVILDKDIEFLDSPSPDNNNKNESIDPTGPETDNSSYFYSTEERNMDVKRENDDEETLQSLMTQNEEEEKVENSVTGIEKEADSSSDQKDEFKDKAEGTNRDDENIETKSMVDMPSGDNSADSTKKDNNSEQESTSVSPTIDLQECGMCFNTINPALALKICDGGHVVCKACFDRQSSELRNICPTCHINIPRYVPQPPNGQMKPGIMERNLLGYEDCGTLYVDYEFPGGIQSPLHPNPGSPYDELSRRTFLPDNKEGREVLELLKKAFNAGILFTVGKSTINGKDNQVIFSADIEHKTNLNGGPSVSGYPDPDYLDRVKTQLKDKGIE